MPVNTTAVKNARLEAVVSQIGSGGKLEIGTAGMASVLATITLEDPAGTASGGVLTLSGFPKSATADARQPSRMPRARVPCGYAPRPHRHPPEDHVPGPAPGAPSVVWCHAGGVSGGVCDADRRKAH